MTGTKKKRNLTPRVRCDCGNNLQTVFINLAGGTKQPIGLFCVHCDTPRQPNEEFLKLKHEKILKTEEKRQHYNFNNKTHCPYCNGTNYTKQKDSFIFYKTPIYEKDGRTIKGHLEKKINKIMKFKCKNQKCQAETHEGKWRVNQSLI